MFKYLRRIGAHSQAPEIEHMPISDSSNIAEGCLCEMSDGYLVSGFDYVKTKFITIEQKVKNDGKTTIACIRALPGMMFETNFVGEPENISAGSLVSPVVSGDGNYRGCGEGEGLLEVVDCSTCAETGRIIVTING